jgi:hypothetical protein
VSKTLLPPPPGFRRQKKTFGNGSVRYVYPFLDTLLGHEAAAIHAGYLKAYDEYWKSSKLRRLAIKQGKEWLGEERLFRVVPADVPHVSLQQVHARRQREAFQVGINLLSFRHPIFIRRNPLDLVFEHLQHNPRYYLKIDLKDAFGSVYPGFHPLFPTVTKEEDGYECEWTGWPFFHPGTQGLIQGAPASPLIFEQACRVVGLDQLIRETAKAGGATVTRYVDDIVFSRREPFGDRFYRTLRERIKALGFLINQEKSGRFDTRWHAIEFLGVSVYRNRITPRPSFFDRLKEVGTVTDGHLAWIDQVNQLNIRLAACRNIWQHQ